MPKKQQHHTQGCSPASPSNSVIRAGRKQGTSRWFPRYTTSHLQDNSAELHIQVKAATSFKAKCCATLQPPTTNQQWYRRVGLPYMARHSRFHHHPREGCRSPPPKAPTGVQASVRLCAGQPGAAGSHPADLQGRAGAGSMDNSLSQSARVRAATQALHGAHAADLTRGGQGEAALPLELQPS